MRFGKSKWFFFKEVYNDFERVKEIKTLLENGYIVFIVDKPPMEWSYYSLYSKEDLIWFIEWVVPKFLNKIDEL